MRVAIVGAGPAGLLLAQHLASPGSPPLDICVLDRRACPTNNDNAPYSYPITLQARGVRALQGIQDDFVTQRLAQQSRWIQQIALHTGPFVQTMSRPEASLVVEYAALTRELIRVVKETSQSESSNPVTFAWDTTVESICWHNQTLVATTAGSDDEEAKLYSYIPFDLLVAADGMHSVVRQSLADYAQTVQRKDNDSVFDCRVKPVPGGFIPFSLQPTARTTPKQNKKATQPLTQDAIHGWMSGKQNILAAFLPERDMDSLHQVDHGTAVFSYTTTESPLKEANTVDDVYKILGKDLSLYVSDEEALGLIQRTPARFVTAECNRLVEPSCHTVLLGDAAHTFSATINQGANAALEDAHVLQQCIRKCITQNNNEKTVDWSSVLNLYQDQRGPEIEAAQILSKYALPTKSVVLQIEMIVRMLLRKLLPSSWTFTQKYFPPLPMELLPHPNLAYTDVLQQTSWWTDKVAYAIQSKNKKGEAYEPDAKDDDSGNAIASKHRIFRFTQ